MEKKIFVFILKSFGLLIVRFRISEQETICNWTTQLKQFLKDGKKKKKKKKRPTKLNLSH